MIRNNETDEFVAWYEGTTSEMFQANNYFKIIDIPVYCKMQVVETLDTQTISQFLVIHMFDL